MIAGLWALMACTRVLRGEEEFFRVTKSFHNAIQGDPVEISPADLEVYLRWNRLNAREIDLYGDYVVLHDPQPCAMRVIVRIGLIVPRTFDTWATPTSFGRRSSSVA